MALWNNRPLVPVPKQGIQMPIGFGGGYGAGGNVPMIRPPSEIQLHSGGGGMGGGGMIPPGAGGNIGNTLSRQSYMPSPKGYNNLTDTGGEGKGKSFLQTYLDLAQWAVPYATRQLHERKGSLMEAETEGLIQRKNMFEDAMTPEGTFKSIEYGGGGGSGGGKGGGGGGGPRVKRSGPTKGNSEGNKPFFSKDEPGFFTTGTDKQRAEMEAQAQAATLAAQGNYEGANAVLAAAGLGGKKPPDKPKDAFSGTPGGGGQPLTSDQIKAFGSQYDVKGGLEKGNYIPPEPIRQTKEGVYTNIPKAEPAPAPVERPLGTSPEYQPQPQPKQLKNEAALPGQGDPLINIDPVTGLMVAPTDEQLKMLDVSYSEGGGGEESSSGDGGGEE